MTSRDLSNVAELAIALLIVLGCAVTAAAQSRERIEYWRATYDELKAAADPRAAKAQAIFERVVQVAGKRPGVVPRLFITATDPWDIALPIALPDGWIILSKGVLDICYRDPVRGDDRLAFVLAHEIAHQLRDDFWHMRFFQAFEASQAETPVAPAFLEEIRRSTSTKEHVLTRELQADEHGIIYAAMAGFNTQAIVSEGHAGNFFGDWVRALDPQRLKGAAAGQMRPTPQERAEALRGHLRRVAEQMAVFQVGLWWYYAGDYAQAIGAFEHFRAYFPSREVLHNLAVSHHHLALQVYQAWNKETPVIPFHLSVTIDPVTRASRIDHGLIQLKREITSFVQAERPKHGPRKAPAEVVARFRRHIDEAIALYREALAYDDAYTPAALNLGCALVLRGVYAEKEGLNADVSEAATVLLRALERTPNSPDTPTILNNLGVALWYDSRPDHAKTHLTRAMTLAPTYAAPVFNLTYIARTEGRDDDARRYQHAYEQLIAGPPTGAPARGASPEQVMGVAVGHRMVSVPQPWGKPTQSTFQLDQKTWTMATYPTGIMTLAQDGKILMIMLREAYPGSSARGIVIGSAARDLLSRYGPPSRRVDLTQGQSWGYDTHRLALQLRDDRVISWLMF
jgi:tetratricopeptide (TPR) repeat protein